MYPVLSTRDLTKDKFAARSNMTCFIRNPSILPGEHVQLECTDVVLDGRHECRITFASVSVEETGGWMSLLGSVTEVSPGKAIADAVIPLVTPGLFLLQGVLFTDSLLLPQVAPGREPELPDLSIARPLNFPLLQEVILEVRSSGTPPRNRDAVLTAYHAVLKARERDYLAGTGRTDDPSAHEFEAVVLLRDCLVGAPIRLGQCMVAPNHGIAPEGEERLVWTFLEEQHIGVPKLTPKEEQERLRPTVRVVFPRVLAHSTDDALTIARETAQEIGDVLALHRGSYPTVVGAVAKAYDSPEVKWTIIGPPSYSGNLITGFLGGEKPAYLLAHLRRLRAEPVLRLHAQLFREARSERNARAAYFRLWGFLETVARAWALDREPISKWNGTAGPAGQKTAANRPAKTLIFELMRRTMGPASGTLTLEWLDGDVVRDRVAIWYRRRNCIAHGGYCACYPSSGTTVRSTEEYERCLAARLEEAGLPFDPYLLSLRDAATAVMRMDLEYQGQA